MAADKEHDERKVEQVIEDKVASDAGGGVANVRVLGEEVEDVAKLEDKEEDPGVCVSRRPSFGGKRRIEVGIGEAIPEDGSNDMIHSKGARVQIVLIPDTLADGEAIMRSVNGVVNRGDDGEEPGDGGEDLVGGEMAGRVRLALGEGVDCKWRVSRATRREARR